MLNQKSSGAYYTSQVDNDTWIQFNFCDPFRPIQCTGDLYTKELAYAFLVNKQATTGLYECIPYTSDSKISYYTPQYLNNNGDIGLNLTMTTNFPNDTLNRSATFFLDCH